MFYISPPGLGRPYGNDVVGHSNNDESLIKTHDLSEYNNDEEYYESYDDYEDGNSEDYYEEYEDEESEKDYGADENDYYDYDYLEEKGENGGENKNLLAKNPCVVWMRRMGPKHPY